MIRAPGPKRDPLDDAIDEVTGARARRAQVTTLHADTTPEQHAKVLGLADQLRVPARAVALDPATFERDRARLELDDLATRSPLLARWAENPDHYALAKDDLGVLESLAEQFGRMRQWRPGDTGRSFFGGAAEGGGMGIAGTGRGLGAVGRDAEQRALEQQDAGEEDSGFDEMIGLLLQDLEAPFRRVGDDVQQGAEAMKVPAARRKFSDEVAGGLGQLNTQVAAGPLRTVSMLGSGAEIAGERADAAKATQAQTDTAVGQGAAVTWLTEKIGLGFLMRKLPGWAQKKLAGKAADVALGGLGEGGQEVVEGLGHDVVAQQYDPNAKIGAGIASDFTVAGAVGLIARAAVGSHARVRTIDDSEQGADWLQRVQKLAADSKTGQRRPEAVTAFVAELKAEGGPQHAYLSAETFLGYYQDEREAFAAAEQLTGDANALPTALAGQGDLQVPIEHFVPFLAKHPEAATAAKLAPDHLSGDEIAAIDREAEVQKVLADFAPKADEVAPVVDEAIEADLAKRWKPAEAKAMASLVTRFYDGLSRATGRTLEAVRAQYPLQVIEARLAGQTLEQPPTRADEVPTGIDPQTVVPAVPVTMPEDASWQAGEAWARATLPATKVAATDGTEVGFGGNTLRKMLRWSGDKPLRMATLRALPDLIRSAPIHATGADPDVKGIRFAYATAAVEFEGQVYPVRLVYRDTTDGQRRLYTFEGFEVDPGAKVAGGTAGAELLSAGLPGPTSVTVAQAAEAFKKRPLFQPADGGRGKGPRGAIQFPQEGIGTGEASLLYLAANADRTTFLHELGHFYLEVLANEAAQADAAPAIARDVQTLLDWFGVADIAAWRALDLEGKRPHHEKLARGFETYLGEGKAPAPGLRGTFRRFKSWVLGVYKDLQALGAPLNDDVRGVFDRLLAADSEIEAAAAQQHYVAAVPIEEAAKLGLSADALVSYRTALERAKEVLGARFLQAKLREKKAWYRDQVKAEIARLEPIIRDQPVYQLRELIKGGRKLDAEATQLAAAFLSPGGISDASTARLRGYTAAGGVSPDVMADLVGYPTAEAMLRDLIEAPPLDVAVREAAESMVLQRHGDPLADARNEALDALHNARLARAMQAELELLAKLAGEAYYADPKVIDEAARRVAARQTARQLQPYQHLVAERKAANEAAKAAAKGKFAEALQHKRAQAFNAALYRHTRAAEKAVQRIRKRAMRLAKKPAQTRLAKAGHDYLAQVNDLLAAYTFRQLSKKEVGRRQSLRAFVERLQEAGEVTAIAEDLLARVESEKPIGFRDVPTAELLALEEALKNIEHLAGLKNKLLAGARKAKLDEAVAELVDRAAVLPSLPSVVSQRDLTWAQKQLAGVRGWAAELTRPETIIEELDGGESGPWHDFLWHPQVAAEAAKLALMKRVGTALKALHAQLPADFWARTDAFVEFKGQRIKRYTLISAAFNLGNAGNRQRLRDGGMATDTQRIQLTDEEMAQIPTLLTAAELRYVQGVWDAVDSMRPDIEALNRRMGGIPVEFVTAAPLTAISSDGETVALRGGYWPLAYDHNKSAIGERQEGDDALKILMSLGASRAATSKGHTQTRVEEVKAPLLLDFGQVLSRSLDQVMTDLSYREAVRDTTMLLKDQRIRGLLISKIGEDGYKSLNGGVAYSVSAGADVAGIAAKKSRRVLDAIMANGVVSALAIRPDIALGNFASALVQGLDRVGKRALLRGMRRLAIDRREMTAEIVAMSPFMDNRLNEIDHEYAQAINTSQGRSGFRTAYFRVMMTLHRTADHEVTRALWWGRYEQERAVGIDHNEAVRLADKAIRQTQTASGRKDLSTVERDTMFKQSRVFMGPMAVIFGRLLSAAKGQGATRTIGARASSLLLQWGLAPAIFALAAGRAPDDDDEDGEWGVDDWSRWLAVNVGAFPLQTIPVVRELAVVVESLVSDAPVSPRASPTAQAAGQMAKASKGLAENLMSDEAVDYSDATRDLVGLSAPLAGLPSSQYRKSDKALEAVLDDPNKGALELTELIVYGKPVYSEPDR